MINHRIAVLLLCLATIPTGSAFAQEATKTMPSRLATLKAGYEAALERATAPIQQKYIAELQKLKSDYTRASDLESALAVDAILKGLIGTPETAAPADPPVGKLSDMTLSQFKRWLRKIQIVELGGAKSLFEFDDPDVKSLRAPNPEPRVHKNVVVELGILRVPFSTDLCVIRFADDLKTATATYDDEPPIQAEIRAKP